MYICDIVQTFLTSSGDRSSHRHAAESSNHLTYVNHVGIHQKQITSTNQLKVAVMCWCISRVVDKTTFLEICFFVGKHGSLLLDPNTVDKENPPKQLNTANILWIAVPESSQLCTLTWSFELPWTKLKQRWKSFFFTEASTSCRIYMYHVYIYIYTHRLYLYIYTLYHCKSSYL